VTMMSAMVFVVSALQPGGAPPTQDSVRASEVSAVAAEPDSLPSLDEVLGLVNAGAAKADKADLNERLSPEELRDEIAKTVALMQRAADRVGGEKDVGLDTQRVQEDVLRRLDKLLEEAERQRQQQQQQQQQNQQNQQNQQQQRSSQQQQQQQQAQAAREQREQATGDQPAGGPAKQAPSGGEVNLAGSATWGNLPPHIREALMQGASDTYSAAYRQLTEQYYRRLARERRP